MEGRKGNGGEGEVAGEESVKRERIGPARTETRRRRRDVETVRAVRSGLDL
jgi:hypothetical protein